MKNEHACVIGAAFHLIIAFTGVAVKSEVVTLIGYIGYFGCFILARIESR